MAVLAIFWLASGNPASALQPLVAVHDSELTRALESMPASGGVPTGAGTTGFQWWPTNWHYFVMPDAVKEALRSDGTAFTVVGDSNITSGNLLDGSGHPNYPILISLASEAVRDDEIPQLTNYVAAGGVLFVGSSAFSRNTNGASRGDFAIASAMGLHMVNAAFTNWNVNFTLTVITNHALVSHIPPGTLTWQMPASSEEISWPEQFHPPNPPNNLPHAIWEVQTNGASVIAAGDSFPFITIKQYGKGWIIYEAAMQPLIGHGGWAPGMYAYGILRNAIQWAFQQQGVPVPKISPWPYAYDSAVIFRHDMEADPTLIGAIETSARYESTNGARGEYYFCTGELKTTLGNSPTTVASLQRAVTNYNAIISSHNGGLTNLHLGLPVYLTNNAASNYDIWHWSPDEMLDDHPSGYANGKAYGLASVSNSFNDLASWFTGTNASGGVKMWVAPYFNATREGSYQIDSQLGIQVTGDDKLSPFPHWIYSTQTPDLKYAVLDLPVSDWFVGTLVAQSMEHHTSGATMQALVDAYYNMGALINLYSHSSSDGSGAAGAIAPGYISYSLSKPRVWSANSAAVYNWWLKRGPVQITPSFSTNGAQTMASMTISGATDPTTSVEFLLPANGIFCSLQVFTNGTLATNGYRLNGQVLKVQVGTTVSNVSVSYYGLASGTQVFTQNFDGVTPPALPSGWTTSSTGFESPWYTTNSPVDTPPNALYCKDATNTGTSDAISPSIVLPTGISQLTFRNNYDLESSPGSDGYDGGVLEIKIGSGSFTDILAAGGSFASGGYTSTIDNTFGSPLAGRQAWSGTSPGFITTVVNLPASAAGQSVQFRWRCGTDNGNGNTGWRIDSIAISNYVCACCSGSSTNPPVLPSQASQTVNEFATLTVTNTATNASVPPDTITYTLLNPPANAQIDANGIITFSPGEGQGPSTNVITTVAFDANNGLTATNSFQVIVNDVNLPPVLPTQTNLTIAEYQTMAVTNTATTQDNPPDSVTYQLIAPPTGAGIDGNGIITWTPTRAQAGTTNVITTVATDFDPDAINAQHLSATNSFTVVVVPVGTCVSSVVFQENFDGVATPNLPANWTTSTSGVEKAWVTTNSQPDTAPNAAFVPDVNNVGLSDLISPTINLPAGQATLSFRSKYGFEVNTGNLSDGYDGGVLEIKIGNGSFNDILAAGGSFVSGGYNCTIDANYSNPLAGRQAWSGTNSSYTTVQVNLPAAASGQAIQLRWGAGCDNGNGGAGWRIDTVSITNQNCTATGGPLLGTVANQTVNELALLTVTNAAVDAQVPPLTLNYTLQSPPAGAAISPSGVITWTPAKNQGPSTNVITTVVSDNGTPSLSATNSFTVVVNEINLPPLLPTQTNFSSIGVAPIVVTNTATDQNVPARTLNYGLQVAPVGATIDTNGVIQWTPTVGQVPSTNTFTTVVTNTDPLAVNATSLTATNSFVVTVIAVHNGPNLGAQTNRSVNELATLTVTNVATDSDYPAWSLAYSLVSPPTGATINPTNGVITWTPAKNQGPSTNAITTVVTDSSPQALSATNSFNVVVNEVNLPPLLPTQTNFSSVATTPIVVTNTATDQNVPAKPMSYGLQVAPVGATIDASGVIHWTPTAGQVPSTNTFTTVVTNTDPGAVNANALTATNSFVVTVTPIHNGPMLATQTNQAVNELVTLTVTNAATDGDIPGYSLTYSLLNPPTGATINSTNGVVTWTPAKNQGPSTNTITTVVTDSSPQALSATNSFSVVVNEVNLPPLLPTQTNFSSVATTPIVVVNTATDQNVPAKPMSYGLQAAPVGATIDANGIIRWTPTAGQVPSTNTFTTVVTNTDPGAVNATSLMATNSFVVTVTPIHNGPALPTQSDQSVNELATMTVTNAATDGDIPGYSLTYSLLNPPAGAMINSTSGVITWTPAKNQGPSTNVITTVVTDSSPEALSATNSFNVVVNEVNLPPLLPAQTNFTSVALAPIVVTNTAADQNVPAKPMSYGFLAAPVGATIDTNGIIQWTPTAGQVPSTNTFTTVVTNTDPGAVNATSLTATNTFVVTVDPIHNGPALPIQADQVVDELSTLVVTNAAVDGDVPAYGLTYSLAGAPSGMSIDTNGVITWTPAKNQGPSTNLITTVVSDGSPEALSATNTFTVVVNEINLPPLLPAQSNFMSVALAPIVVTNTATDQNIPAKPLSYGFLAAPVGATIDANGVINWTPTAGQVPSTNTFTTVVTNSDPAAANATSLTATNTFVVTVSAIHNGPVLPPQSDRAGFEFLEITVTNTATSSDIPALAFNYHLVSPPVGAHIDSNGIITWTPPEGSDHGTNIFTTVVTDSGSLSATNSFMIVVSDPPQPTILSVKVTNSVAAVTWSTLAGEKYRLQFRNSNSDHGWDDVMPDVMASGSTATQTNGVGNTTQRFYRVFVVPQ